MLLGPLGAPTTSLRRHLALGDLGLLVVEVVGLLRFVPDALPLGERFVSYACLDLRDLLRSVADVDVELVALRRPGGGEGVRLISVHLDLPEGARRIGPPYGIKGMVREETTPLLRGAEPLTELREELARDVHGEKDHVAVRTEVQAHRK